MRRARTYARCQRCGAELLARDDLGKRAHAEGLCIDCWLDPSSTAANEQHRAERHDAGGCAVVGCDCTGYGRGGEGA